LKKADPLWCGIVRIGHELPDRIEHDFEIGVLLPFQPVEAGGQVCVLDHQAAEPHVRKAAFYDRPNLRSQIGDG
jgi:hypothetical protein